MIKANMKELKVGVHDGIFHSDDALCVAMVDLILHPKKLTVVRSRDKNLLKLCDFILDVGGSDYISDLTVMLDHHQEETETDFYENGIKKAACGKLFEYLWQKRFFAQKYDLLNKSDNELIKIKNKLLEKIFYPVESMDNGQTVEGVENNKFAFTHSMIPPYNKQDADTLMKAFIETKDMIKKVFDNIVNCIITEVDSEEEIIDLINKRDMDGFGKNILIMDKFLPWIDPVIKYNANPENKNIIKIVIFKNSIKDYRAQVVPVGDPNNRFKSYILFPESWGAKRGEELENESGIKGAIFCHPGLFISGWDNLNSAIRAAEKSIYEDELDTFDATF